MNNRSTSLNNRATEAPSPLGLHPGSLEFALLDHVAVPLAAIDTEGRQTFVNQAFCKLVNWSAAELVGQMPPFKFWSSAHHDEIAGALRRRLNGDAPYGDVEFMMQNRTGEIFPVRINIRPVVQDGRTVGWIAAVIELSDEIEKKRQLALSEMQFRAIAEHIDEVFYLSDNLTGQILYISPSYERVWGVPRETLYSDPPSYIKSILEEDRTIAISALEQQLEGRHTRIEYRIRHPDGTLVYIDDQSYPFEDHGNSWTVGLAADITKRKVVESSLRISHEMLQTAQEVAQFGNWTLDPATHRCELSATVFHLLGYPAPKQDYASASLCKERAETLLSMLAARFDTLKTRQLEEILFAGGEITSEVRVGADQTRWLHLRTRSIADSEGHTASVTGVIQDVTDFYERSELITQLRKMDALGQLSGGLAHDLNNIFGIVIANLEDLAETAKADDPFRDNLDGALVAAKRGADLVQSLLAFARKRPSSEVRVMHVDDHLDNLSSMIRFVLGVRSRLETRLDSGESAVHVDPAMFDSSILNIVINARDAMPQGSNLILSTTRRRLRLEQGAAVDAVDADCVVISLEDNGIGMSADVMSHALEPYFTTKGRESGTGLGLSQVHAFVKSSGGTLQLRSEFGKGTTVSIILPVAITTAAVTGEAGQAERSFSASQTKSILFVDDEIGLRKIARRVLERQGHHVHVADSAEEAQKVLESNAIDVLVTDIIMPGTEDGMALAKWTRQRFPRIGIIGMSGNTDLSHEFERYGGLFLRKPVLNARLIKAVESLNPSDQA